jgi:hypothetical protein
MRLPVQDSPPFGNPLACSTQSSASVMDFQIIDNRTFIPVASLCPSTASIGGCFPDPCGVNFAPVSMSRSVKMEIVSQCYNFKFMAHRGINGTGIHSNKSSEEYYYYLLTDNLNYKYIQIAPSNYDRTALNATSVLPLGYKIDRKMISSDFTIEPFNPATTSDNSKKVNACIIFLYIRSFPPPLFFIASATSP